MKKPKKEAVAEEFDFSSYREEVIQGLIQRKGLRGEGGLPKPLIANFIEGALSAELKEHLDEEKAKGLANKRNGHQSRPLRSESGDLEINYSRDRNVHWERMYGAHWKGKYDLVVQLWLKDWGDLMGCMNLSPAIKKIIYTTNAIEKLNREIRRVTRSKARWGSDRALLIQLFLAMDRKKQSWNRTALGWNTIHRELSTKQPECFNNYFPTL